MRVIGERDVIHDDVFVERFDKLLANHGIRDAKQTFRQRVGFHLREDAALRIKQQRNVAMRWWQILDVIGENGVEIAHAVWAGEGEIGAIIFIDQRYRFMREPVFALPIAEIIGQSAAEPHAHFRPGLLMQRRERRVEYFCGFGGLHTRRRLAPSTV